MDKNPIKQLTEQLSSLLISVKSIADEIKSLNQRVSNLKVPQNPVQPTNSQLFAYAEQSNTQYTQQQMNSINTSLELSSLIRFKDAVDTSSTVIRCPFSIVTS